MNRKFFRIVLAVAVLGYFAYGYVSQLGTTSHAATAPPIPARATVVTLGSLQFTSCALTQKKSGATTQAFCAPFPVLENRQAPETSRKIDLNLALIKSEAEAADPDVVVFLAGGPGQAAVEAWPHIAGALAPLRRHHHILLLDQRGTGSSHPLTCSMGEQSDAEERFDLSVVRARVRACLAELEKSADVGAYTTTAAVADLEAVRQALGAPQLDLVGVSYGTRMAQQFVVRHPDAVRSVVLDSVAPNELVLGQDFAINLENALKAQFAQCTQTPACAMEFGDTYASMLKLRDALRAKPQSWDFRDPLTFAPVHKQLDEYALAGLVRIFAYTPETAALLPLSIAEGLQGNYTPLAGQTRLLAGDLSELRDSGMQLSVLCAEDADFLAPRPQDADTLLGTSMIDAIKTECEVWPHGSRPADFHAPLKTDTPVLILEGELDPVTPPRYGEQVLKGLGNARLLIAKGQGHNVIGRGCMPKLVEEFVNKLQPKSLDAKCLDVLGPTPALLNFNGAAP